MNQLAGLVVVFSAGTAGFLFFRRIKVPNPALLGAIFATGIMSVSGYYPAIPSRWVTFFSNMTIGVILGRQIDRKVVERVINLARFILIQVVGMLALSLVSGCALHKMTDLSPATAMLSGAAGGIAEMSAFAISIDADAAAVAFIQLFRIVTFMTLIPYLSILAKKLEARKNVTRQGDPNEKKEKSKPVFFSRKDYFILIVTAFAGAFTANWLKIPTGALLGAMCACGICVLCLNKTYKYDVRIRHAAQIGLGLIMGERIGPETIPLLGRLFVPGLIITLIMLVGCVSLAFILHWSSGWDFVSCLLCAAPAGLSQIAAYAEEIGADSFTASIFHTVRIVGIVSFYPWIVPMF